MYYNVVVSRAGEGDLVYVVRWSDGCYRVNRLHSKVMDAATFLMLTHVALEDFRMYYCYTFYVSMPQGIPMQFS